MNSRGLAALDGGAAPLRGGEALDRRALASQGHEISWDHADKP
jgi:hypothetical protein